jgi:hypothetical protein
MRLRNCFVGLTENKPRQRVRIKIGSSHSLRPKKQSLRNLDIL